MLEPLDRDKSRQGLTFAFNDELVVPEGDAIQHVADPLANLDGRNLISHLQKPVQVAIYFMWYNFGRVHQTLRVTPAVEAGIADHVWAIEEIVALIG